ncbi:MAG TPA: stage II sporulation protein P [Limnochordia bacterium]|nr:stage II sporulation protein P [Bacillota bacterium]HOB07855.1 stage II sporulation protein P [Limnochordia bacterium]HPZ29992.1 stage II sporulation protein P [Limnochordia bacterium]HXK96238.1 stage II sporulation protein P [Limnochordia bacterium]
MARIRRKEKSGPGLLFVLVTLVVVAVVGARFFGFYPGGEKEQVPQPPSFDEDSGTPPPSVPQIPKVLVLHSHTTENYQPKDSHQQDGEPGDVVQVGRVFVQALMEKGIAAVHDQTIHDRPRYSEAFINSAKVIERALAENNQIQMVLDIHRDGLQDKPEGYTTVEINGEKVAKILFIIGDQDNKLVEANMAFAKRISDALEAKYPGVSRGVRVFKSDYSGDLHPNSVMVVIGDWKGNTLEEATRSALLLAEVVAPLIK